MLWICRNFQPAAELLCFVEKFKMATSTNSDFVGSNICFQVVIFSVCAKLCAKMRHYNQVVDFVETKI